ncbi:MULTISPECIES: hypothetical protein [unclassified Arenibacter]|uniref:hypothetical protein n=1 Tax=unclassified Arenibacter TaxID=2615047 RepID=UPI000E347ADD|nr:MULTISPECIES: hypothetical protein [unclassified Arenibacter]MCM4162012.1 hypothetical protein [Arenibacter sp. A80]RFT57638.1 hypothetical protein D0S24_00245 [Arenibacter sp. P308M17]
MKRVFFLLLVASFTLFTSCDIDDDVNYHFEALQVKSVEMPEAFDYGEIYNIKVTYFRPNNCTFFEGFDVVKEDLTTRKVVTIGTVIDDEDDCSGTGEDLVATFNFEVLYDEPYIFRYWTGEDANGEPTYLEITVPVNEDTSAIMASESKLGTTHLKN